ncbi:MAG: guanine deaminase [Deltaproteobacteria bacterium CG11_big_fil_rev_8_21_14_0_20_47_16]|nr:MAG: guanine deaminase [Deltaproteobacteria bacterium CG11_big_fil_rev_8_21_14_0_20_47_16]
MVENLNNAVHAVRGHIQYMQDATTLVEIQDGLLAWDSTGHIVACDEHKKINSLLPKSVNVDNHSGKLVVPGFVDCHVHLPQLDCRNKTGHTLLDWLKNYIFPAEAAFSDVIFARSIAKRFFLEILQNGTTTAMIYSTIHEAATNVAFEEADNCGIRAIIGKVMMDQNCPDALKENTKESLSGSERLISKWHGHKDRLFYAMTPRFALTCSRDLIVGAGQMAQDANVYFQTHLSETPDEVAFAKEMHGFSDYVDFYGDCHCLGKKSMYAHCIYPTDSEWQGLSQSQSAIAHCPSSNIFLRSGRMPYEKIAEYHVRCGLGSDVGAGPKFSMWDVMRCGQEQHTKNVFSNKNAFYHATLGGAEALGLSDQIGSFHVGKKADVVVFDVPTSFNAIEQIPMAAATYVSGKMCYLGKE